MPKPIEYKVIEANTSQALQQKLNDEIKNGFRLASNLVPWGTGYLAAVLVKETSA